jgi:hypothetical protein
MPRSGEESEDRVISRDAVLDRTSGQLLGIGKQRRQAIGTWLHQKLEVQLRLTPKARIY